MSAHRKPAQREHYEQAAFIKACRALPQSKYPLAHLVYAIPNAAKRSYKLAAWMRAEGMEDGTPDVHLPVSQLVIAALTGERLITPPDVPGASLYIEMKDPAKYGTKAGAPTARQLERHQALRRGGNIVVVAYGCNAALGAVYDYYRDPLSHRMLHTIYEPFRFPPTL